jgi:hypothetical protein
MCLSPPCMETELPLTQEVGVPPYPHCEETELLTGRCFLEEKNLCELYYFIAKRRQLRVLYSVMNVHYTLRAWILSNHRPSDNQLKDLNNYN